MLPSLSWLTLRQKFLLLGILGLLLVEPPLWVYVIETNEAIDFTEGERQGIVPGQAALELLQFIQQHRGLSAAFLGAGKAAEARAAKQAEADRMLLTLETAIRQVPHFQGLTGNLRAEWTELTRDVNTRQLTVHESYDRHTAIAQNLVEIIEKISDESGLSLDPETISYYLVRTTYYDVPAATEALGELRAKGASVLAVHEITIDERTLMYELISRASSTSRRLTASLKRVMTVDQVLEKKLKRLQEMVETESRESQRLGRDEIAATTYLTYPVVDFLEVLTKSIDLHFTLARSTIGELDNVLMTRAEHKRIKRDVLVAVVALIATAAALVGWRISISIRNPIQKSLEIAEAVAGGQIDNPIDEVQTAGADEGARMLLALGRMQQSLRLAMAAENARKHDFFRNLLETASEAMVIVDRAGMIFLVNAQAEKLFGYARETMIGQPVEMLVPPRSRGHHLSLRDGFFAVPEKRPIGMRRTLLASRSDGSEFPVEISLSPLETEGGLVVASSIRDISERIAIETALRASQDRLQLLLDSAAESIYGIDMDGCCTFANQACLRLLGYETGEELHGKEMHSLIHHTHADGHAYEVADCLIYQALRENKGTHSDAEVFWRKDGSSFPVEYWSYPQREGGAVIGAVVTFMDASARKQTERELENHRLHLEELVAARTEELGRTNRYLHNAMAKLVQIEKMASLGRVVAGVAHELNTPLGNMLLMASTLKNNSEKFAQDVEAGKISRTQLLEFTCICQEASAFIERNSSRAADLIESFKKVSVDQTSERRRSFNLQQLVMDVVATHHNSWKRTTHQIDVDVPEELEIDGYPGALEQIISNLIENSLVHGFEGMEQGCVKIAAARDGELIHLVYSDTGHGIALQNLSKIFDPFFTTRLGKGGSGLGLYLVQQLLTNVLDGTIKVISEPERGCRFEIAFPVVIPGLVRQDRQDRA